MLQGESNLSLCHDENQRSWWWKLWWVEARTEEMPGAILASAVQGWARQKEGFAAGRVEESRGKKSEKRRAATAVKRRRRQARRVK